MTYQELFEKYCPGGRVAGENYIAQCCFHDDQHASFSGHIGKGLWLCFACGAKGSVRAFAQRVGEDFTTLLMDATAAKEWTPEERAQIDQDRRGHFYTWESDLVATYDYTNETGEELLYQICKFVRVEDDHRQKWFIPRYPEPAAADGWCYVDVFKRRQRVLYRLSDLGSRKVYFPEGEADVDILRFSDLAATTYPGGAQFAVEKHAEILAPLKGKDVVLLSDNDEPGHKRITEHLLPALRSIARSIVQVDLPGVPEHGDISWWLTDGNHTIEEFLALPETILKAAPLEWRLPVHRASTIEPRAVQWFLKGYIPLARPVFVQGASGQGKTWFVQGLLTATSLGRWPFGLQGQGPASCLYLFSEDDMHEDVVPRLQAQGADLSRIGLIPRPLKQQQDGRTARFTLHDLSVLGREVQETQSRLVILDPIQAFLPPGVNMNRMEDARPLMEKLHAFARAYQIGLVCVRHHAKGKAGTDLSERGSGSQDWFNASRASLVVVERKTDYDFLTDTSHHSALALKINSGRTPREAIDFALGPGNLEFTWTGLTKRTEEELAGKQQDMNSEQRGTMETIQPFIVTRLRQRRCPLSELIAVVKDALPGISKMKALSALMTFKTQHTELIISEEIGLGGGKEPAWSLAETPLPQDQPRAWVQ